MRPVSTLIASLLVSSLYSQDVIDYKSLGFTFSPPVFESTASGQVIMAFAPASNAFAANVNVQIQPFAGTLLDYDKLTKAQLQAEKFKALVEKKLGNELFYEYTGSMSGRDMHWAVRAIKKDAQIYLITATALESEWEASSITLLGSLDSFKLNNK